MEDLNNVPSSGTYGAAITEVNRNFSLIVNAINSLEYATTKSKGIYNNGFTPNTTTLPNSVDGDWCMVLGTGNTFPARIWTYNGTTWAQGGEWNPEGLDLTGYATTAAMNTAIANSLLQATARMGYGEATASNNAYSVTIANYTLPTNGGVVRVKMPTAATGAATLNITNTGVKTIWYNGKAVSSTNTWAAEEIISVFYDGTKYISSNSQGGGGAAEKIKYDNSLGYLSANNVQDAIDDVASEVKSLYLGTTMLEPGGIYNNNGQPDNSIKTNSRTKYLALGTATSVIIYNNKTVDGHSLYFKYIWYNSSKVFTNIYQTWTSGTTAQIPSSALGGYVRIVFSKNPSGTTTPSDIAQFKLYLNIYGYEGLGDKLKELEEKVSENKNDIDEINNSIGGVYLDTTNIVSGTTSNSTGADATDTNNNCCRTTYLPLGDATYVKIYNYRELNGYRISFKYAWYDANKAHITTIDWRTGDNGTYATIPISAIGGYVRIVMSRQPTTTSTPSDYANYKMYLNIYGHDSLDNRVSALENSEEDMSATAQIIKGLAPKSITICTWNIGHFSGDGSRPSSPITGSDYDTKLAQFRDLIYNTINPRMIALNEYSAVFGKDSNNVSHNARDVLFNDFVMKFEGTQNNYSCNAVFGNTYLTNIKMQKFEHLTHDAVSGGYQDDYYYIIADLYMEGRLVKFVSTHFAFNNNLGGELQSIQIQDLVNALAQYDRVVVAGDLNLNGDSERFNVFVNAGYTIGNDGSIATHPSGSAQALDNIIYKGVVVSDMRAITSSLSDHYPLVATITV